MFRATNRPSARIILWGAALLALTALPRGGVAAQENVEDRIRQAESHEARADDFARTVPRMDRAVWHYRRAAELRPEGDPQGFRNLELAGRLSFHLGKVDDSLRDLTRAADRALRGGDVLAAAHLFADAAWVASEAGRGDVARERLERARILANAPTLPEHVRDELVTRLEVMAGERTATPSRTSQR